MGITRKIKLESLFLFLFLVIFPFGQITRMSFDLLSLNIPLLPLDIIAGLAALYSLFFQRKKSSITKYLSFFFFVCLFSFVLSVFYFGKEVVYGLFYLIRLFSYFMFFNYVWNFIKENKANKNLMMSSLLGVSVVSAVFGWIQYLAVPDLRPLFYLNWDDILYRLTGTFLDPTYLGLILVFGLMISVNRLIEKRSAPNILITVFLLTTLAFTYSRASYLALLVGLGTLALLKKKIKKVLLVGVFLLALLPFLPTSKSPINVLTRTFTINARFTNYKETLQIFSKHPLLGVGYNNLCIARNIYLYETPFSSHACSGSDSSLLFILAATGVVGMMVFVGVVLRIGKILGSATPIIFASITALFVHSFFSNSLFYPWIMGYMGILLATGIKE